MDQAIALSVENLVGGYGSMTILNGTTFEVPEGSITTVIGPNGAGKSTVFKAIFGLLKLRQGRVVFHGQDVTGKSQRQLLDAGICYIPQGRNIFPELSVRTNIELGTVAAGKSISNIAERIERGLDRFPSLRKLGDKQAGTLSGGLQKQLEIVRGLLLEPRLVLIDEPSIGLSPALTDVMFGVVKSLNDQGITVLLVEQNVAKSLALSSRGYVLENGSVVLHGSSGELLENPDVQRAYLGM